ncbi:ABC transporter permease [Micromonospora marina]|uniref:ABC transporter permease n=1 Tax=Micromonospora marina TaxID=307120 RepID=UPI003451E05A
MTLLRTQLAGVTRRPARLLLTGLAVLVASFVVYATVLTQQITERTVLDRLSGTPATVDLVLGGSDPEHAYRVTTADLAAIAQLPGVAEAVGRVSVPMQLAGEFVVITADSGTGPLAVTRVAQGAFPSGTGEVAVTPRTADRLGLPVGTTFTLPSEWDDAGKPRRATTLRVSGVVTAASDDGATLYAPQPVVSSLATDEHLTQVDVRLAPGVDPARVRAAMERVAANSPAPQDGSRRPEVMSGAAKRTIEAQTIIKSLDDVFAAVGVFVAVAVGAAGLVAASTFRIVFAQRMRQLALLRAVGAGRGGLGRALAVEGALTGLVAGVMGVLGALAVGNALPSVLRAAGIAVAQPGFPIVAAAGVVLLAVSITVVAVLAPAASAGRVAPLEALRSTGTTGGRRGIGVLRGVAGLAFLAGAVALAAFAVVRLPDRDTTNYSPVPALLAIVGSGFLAYVALIGLGPLLVRPVLAVVGLPLRRLGPVGRLASGGVGGAPRRAAAVSVVVAIGVTLISGVLVAGASARTVADRAMAASAPADFELAATSGALLPEGVLERATTDRSLEHVTGYRRLGDGRVNDAATSLEITDLDLRALPALGRLDVTEGSLTGLGPGQALLSDAVADETGLRVGDRASVAVGAATVTVRVAATSEQLPLYTQLVLHPTDLTSLGAPVALSGLLADAVEPGEQGRTAGLRALRQMVQGTTDVAVTVLADERDDFHRILNTLLAVAIGLVGLTVLIAVVGVGTTTALSVVERVREAGLLRAIGLSRSGLRAMVTAEAGLYGLIGAALGVLLGVPYAWLAVKALSVGAPLELPVWQLAVVVLALVSVTALTGVLPARRAARVDPVVALTAD